MDGLQIQWLLDPRLEMATDFRAFAAMPARELRANARPAL
jgi:hypothetical protein